MFLKIGILYYNINISLKIPLFRGIITGLLKSLFQGSISQESTVTFDPVRFYINTLQQDSILFKLLGSFLAYLNKFQYEKDHQFISQIYLFCSYLYNEGYIVLHPYYK